MLELYLIRRASDFLTEGPREGLHLTLSKNDL